MLAFMIGHINLVFAMIWAIFLAFVFLKFFSSSRFVSISWSKFLGVAVLLNVLSAVLLSFVQYVAWSSGGLGVELLKQPLPGNVPLPVFFEWTRTFFEHSGGYFGFYILGRFFVPVMILFGLVGAFAAFLHLYARQHPNNFKEGDIPVIVIAALASGWPGIVALAPLAFLFAIVFSIFGRFYGITRVRLSSAFLVAAPFVIFFGHTLLNYFNLYSLLKL